MECPIRDETDFAGYLLQPDSPEWEPFRRHYPTCPECAAELAAWTRLEEGARRAAASEAPSHPREERLLALQDDPRSLDGQERTSLEEHLLRCAQCRDALQAVTGLDAEKLQRAGRVTGSATRPPRRQPRWLGGGAPRPVLAAALLALVLLPLGLLLWSQPGDPVEGPTPGPLEEIASADPAPDVAEPTESPASPTALGEPRLAKAENPPATALPEPPAPEPPPATPAPKATEPEVPSALAELPPPAGPDARAMAGGPPGPGQEAAELEPAPDAALLVAALARSAPPVYVPPQRGAPSVRIGGGTRSAGYDLPLVLALAPEHEGLTVSESPTLYWFLSREASIPVEFVLTDPAQANPVIDMQIEPPVAPGIYSVRLDQRGVVLEPGTAYRWFVSLVPDTTRRSSDVISGGVVRRVAPNAQLEAQLGEVAPDRVGHVYAEHGLWYDALAFWSQWIEEMPNEPRLRTQRAALLEQAGLAAAAAVEERQEGEGGRPR